MKKIKFNDLTILDYQKLVKLFHKESDRAAAVLAGSYAEYFLGKYLRSFMVDDINEEKLFGGFGPFATFAQRIDASYAFNLIGTNIRNDLRYIKDIRNHFAHHPKETSFESKEIKSLCKKLTTAQPIVIEGSNKTHTVTDTRSQYLFAIGIFTGYAHNRMLTRQRQEKTNNT